MTPRETPQFALLFVALVTFVLGAATERRARGQDESSRAPSWRTVERVIDGDTIVLDGGEHVRLIGVDSPETVDPRKPVEAFGREAKAFTKQMVEGVRVRVEYEAGNRLDRRA